MSNKTGQVSQSADRVGGVSSGGEAVEAGEVRSGLCVPAERERSGTAIREKTVTRRRGLSGQLIILLGQLSS